MSPRFASALLALALVASAAHAASTPAHSKGKKGSAATCPDPVRCNLATAARVAALELANTVNFAYVETQYTIDSASPGKDCDDVEVAFTNKAAEDWPVNCYLRTAWAPATLQVFGGCADEGPAAGIVSQYYCEAYVTDGLGSIISGLPTYTSGAFGSGAGCQVDTSGLADGQTVGVRFSITCSDYSAFPVGGKTAALPDLKEFINKKN